MIDMQCGASSTTITIPDEIDTNYFWNTRTQTWEATNTQNSIYFEFEAWTSTTGACPIIEYKIDVTSIVATNENAITPNSKYGKDSSANFLYQSGTACTPSTSDDTDCGARQQPTFNNNTGWAFTSKTGAGLDAYSPDDIQQYADEDQTTLKRDGGAAGNTGSYHYTATSTAGDLINVFRPDSQVLHVLDCTAYHNQMGACTRPTYSPSPGGDPPF